MINKIVFITILSLMMLAFFFRERSSRPQLSSFKVTSFTSKYIPAYETQGKISHSNNQISIILPSAPLSSIKVQATAKNGLIKYNNKKLTTVDYEIDTKKENKLTVFKGTKSRTYSININYSGLPSMILNTKNHTKIDSRLKYIDSSLAIVSKKGKKPIELFISKMEIRGRGNSTWKLPKKSYRIHLQAPISILNMPKSKNWNLVARYSDKSLMRNFLAFEAAKAMDFIKYTPSIRFVELYINGKYQGNYLLTEHISVGKNKIELPKKIHNNDISFFLKINSNLEYSKPRIKNHHYFISKKGIIYFFKHPSPSKITPTQKDNIINFINNAEDKMCSKEQYLKYIDQNNFIDWLIIEELFKNMDSDLKSSVYVYKRSNTPMKLGPVWDFDLAAGNSNYDKIGGIPISSHKGWLPSTSIWFSCLLAHKEFNNSFKNRWNSKKDILIKTIMSSIKKASSSLRYSQERNFKRWDILSKYVWPNPSPIIKANSHGKQVDFLKEWIQKRFRWMDKNINKTKI